MVLVAITQLQDVAFVGQIDGVGSTRVVRTYKNNAKFVAGVTDVNITAVNSATYVFKINDITITWTADASATLAEQQAAATAAIAASTFATALVTVANQANGIRLTEKDPTKGAVVVTESDANITLTVVTAHTDEEPMPAGIMVAQGPNAGECRLMRSSTDQMVGITEHQHNAAADEKVTGTQLYAANSLVNAVARAEGIWVTVEEAVTPASGVFVRYAPGAGGTQLGAFRASADTATAVQNTSLRYLDSASGGGKVRVGIALV